MTLEPSSQDQAAPDRATLERECEVEYFTGPGPGGQHRNRTRNAVRLHHRPTGIIVTATERRSQLQNLDAAFERLSARLAKLRHKPKPRRPTRPTGGSRRARLEGKSRRSRVKQFRKRPGGED